MLGGITTAIDLAFLGLFLIALGGLIFGALRNRWRDQTETPFGLAYERIMGAAQRKVHARELAEMEAEGAPIWKPEARRQQG